MKSAAHFAVNGRFLGQKVTGVQRYARSVVGAIDALLLERGAIAPILAPTGVEDLQLKAMPLRTLAPLGGHPWEQLVLPARWRGPLLNLCNTAPVSLTRQVVCIHDANAFLAPEAYSRSFRVFYKRLQPLLARRSAAITTVSHFSARQISKHLPVDLSKIVVLPNGHDHALAWEPGLAEIAPRCLADLGWEGDRLFVLAIGSQARHKNLQLLLDIADDLAALGISIVVAGGSDSIFGASGLKAHPNVGAIGYVSDHDLAYLMERALCLVFPSFTEGFGLPIVEAMARGCPVVSSDRASMPEVCGDAALMASPDEPLQWVEHIRRLAGSRDLRAELVGLGRERVTHFTWAATAAGYIELLEAAKAG